MRMILVLVALVFMDVIVLDKRRKLKGAHVKNA
jgi:hypothetical protein